ncbi:RNB domain-containing ribonuclease [Streptomyces wedmorensis]|uniref:RNB domain-containing ribonuclease n=1 Tax=Streptomyces wedmorensis TaxID=43759 RepID=UPI00341D5088
MRRPRMHMSREAQDALRKPLQLLRAELKATTEFPAHVLEAAMKAVDDVRLPDKDAPHLPLFTIDPPTSKDLDQAMHLERRSGGGYRVHYAIADVAAFAKAGSALDAEAHDRIETLHFPDLKVPLHPPSISEGPAGLLPGRAVPALLCQHDLDADGNVIRSTVSRAKVRSQAKLSYAKVQQVINTDAEDNDPKEGTVHLADPAVMGKITSGSKLDLGANVQAKLIRADPLFSGREKVLFDVV